ncbi:MAG: NAD-dependent deacylase [Acidobacteriia bacterium]|nr:NAD-dependent deacylase [Terriglobia bacterium]
MGSPAPSEALLSLLRGQGPVLLLTGAGVSAESGLATFRGPSGLWEGRDPAELATPDAFAADPLGVWRFYAWRRKEAAAARPNAGHLALAALERGRDDVLLVTQNVDGLHERAGSRRIVRLHGSLFRLRCTEEGTEFEDLGSDLSPLPPRCACGALLRPGVVWFGEPLPAEGLRAAATAARRAVVVIVAGTSSLVYPAASLPVAAREAGAYVVEVNPEPTPMSSLAHERLRGPAGEILPRIVEAAGIEPARTA